MRFKILRKYVPGGPVQDVTQQAIATTQPAAISQPSDLIAPNFVVNPDMAAYAGDGTMTYPVSQGVGIPEGTGPDMASLNQDLQDYVERNTPKPIEVDTEQGSVARSQDGNPFDAMTMPYMSLDLNSRAASLGRSIGRAGVAGQMWNDAQNRGERALAGTARGANIAQGIFSGISLAAGMGRQIASAASEERARMQDLMGYRQNLRESRLNSMTRYDEGGKVNLGRGQSFGTTGLTGEYIYPLPKPMEEQANVEIEKGEYVLQPDIVGPQEAKGKKHEEGGTPVSLPDARIISDYRTAGDEFAAMVRERYGIKANPKDTYATLLDKYKKKLGLKEKYEEQEKILKRLKNIEDIDDENTKRLNKSVISKYLSENQAEVDDMELSFRQFADVVYAAQESAKRQEKIDNLFRDGGPVKKSQLKAFMKAGGFTEKEAKEKIYDAWMRKKRMPGGGPTREQVENFARLANSAFGRNLNFNLVNVPGYENILNPGSDINADQGLQHINGVGYGNASVVESMNNLINKTNRWAMPLYQNGDLDVDAFQTGYNQQLAFANALADSGIISNADAMRQFAGNYGFYGQPGALTGDSATNSRAVDNKYGQTTATRAFYSLDVLTPEQLKQLNDNGISNFVDIWNNQDTARKILGDDMMGKLEGLRDAEGFNGMDFILAAHEPGETEAPTSLPEAPMLELTPEDEADPTLDPGTIPSEGEPSGENPDNSNGNGSRRQDIYPGGYAFPEVLRPVSNGIVTPGLERAPRYHVNPVTESADQYINELNRQTQSQLDSLGEVPGQQRAAILANLNAIAGNQIGQYITGVNYRNANARMQARVMNENGRIRQIYDDNTYRQNYQQQVLTAMSLADENRARYYDSVNNEIQTKWNTANSLNMIRSLAPNIRMMPNGQMVYAPNGQDTLTPGDWSTPAVQEMNNQYAIARGARPKVETIERERRTS